MSTISRRAFRDADMRDLYVRALRLGWAAEMKGSGHVMMYSPDKRATMFLSITSGGGRAVANNEAALKRWQKENSK